MQTIQSPVNRDPDLPPLRAVRRARGLGLRQVARAANIDPAHLSRIERGLSRPSIHVLKALADTLGLRELADFLAPYEPSL